LFYWFLFSRLLFYWFLFPSLYIYRFSSWTLFFWIFSLFLCRWFHTTWFITLWFFFIFNFLLLLSLIGFCFPFLCLWCFLPRRSLVWLLSWWLLHLLSRLLFPQRGIFLLWSLRSTLLLLALRNLLFWCHNWFCHPWCYRLIFGYCDFLFFLLRILLFPRYLWRLRLSNLFLTRSSLFRLRLYFFLTFWRSSWVGRPSANWLENVWRTHRRLSSLPLLPQEGIQKLLVAVAPIEFFIIIIHLRFSETGHDWFLIIIVLLITSSIHIVILFHIHTLIQQLTLSKHYIYIYINIITDSA